MNRTGIFHLKLCRQKRCKSRSRIRGQTCQLSQPATRPGLGFKTVVIDSLDPSPHLEKQENYAKLVLSEQIFPTPKYEPNDKQTVLFFWGGWGVGGRKLAREVRVVGAAPATAACHTACLWSCLASPSASTFAWCLILASGPAQSSAAQRAELPFAQERKCCSSLFLFTHLPKSLLTWVPWSFIWSLSRTWEARAGRLAWPFTPGTLRQG